MVLNGAKSLALPTKFGQSLVIEKNTLSKENFLYWHSLDLDNNTWFSCIFELPSLKIIKKTNDSVSKTLQKIVQEVKKINPTFLNKNETIRVTTKLSFPINWGLGTSSTLINNIASWAKINAFDLQFKIFGGSAYDIACAQNNTPILYNLKGNVPIIKPTSFNPSFKKQLFFIYLNKKQNSRDAIKVYQKYTKNKDSLISEINHLTELISKATNITDFRKLLKEHETIISKVIRKKPIQEVLFSDYFGQIKSLGAWGGDFILATGNEKTTDYFKQKGYNTIIPYSEIILS